ncbi:hypothetical protein Droror1_Dr00010312 [Drosera rotundifolia]
MSTSEESTENSMAQVLKALQVLTVRIDGMNQQLGDVATRLTVVERRPRSGISRHLAISRRRHAEGRHEDIISIRGESSNQLVHRLTQTPIGSLSQTNSIRQDLSPTLRPTSTSAGVTCPTSSPTSLARNSSHPVMVGCAEMEQLLVSCRKVKGSKREFVSSHVA